MIFSRFSPRSAFAITFFALLLATTVLAQNDITDRGVQKRVNTMRRANIALITLSDMMGAKILFDKDYAKSARRDLIAATDNIPSVFRRPHSDPHSHARPRIWVQWSDFKARAKLAEQAARDLNTKSLAKLRLTLPKLVIACHACHKTYRAQLRYSYK